MEWGNLLFSSYLFQILKERIYPQTKRHYLMWNTPPGGLSISPTFSHTLKDYPFYVNALSENPADKFTAIIVAVTPVSKPSAPLFKLIQVINNCKHVDQVNLWDCKFLVRYLVWNHNWIWTANWIWIFICSQRIWFQRSDWFLVETNWIVRFRHLQNHVTGSYLKYCSLKTSYHLVLEEFCYQI